MIVVLDTNVLLSAFISQGVCGELMTRCLSDHRLALSDHLCGELRRHLVRKARHTPDDADRVVAFLRAESLFVVPVAVPRGACRDPNDLPVLGTALAAGADALVTGDQHLLELSAFEGIPILSPRHFHERLGMLNR